MVSLSSSHPFEATRMEADLLLRWSAAARCYRGITPATIDQANAETRKAKNGNSRTCIARKSRPGSRSHGPRERRGDRNERQKLPRTIPFFTANRIEIRIASLLRDVVARFLPLLELAHSTVQDAGLTEKSASRYADVLISEWLPELRTHHCYDENPTARNQLCHSDVGELSFCL